MLGAPRRAAGDSPATLYLGTVSKIDGATALVVIPELGGKSFTYGPARIPDHYDPAATNGPTRPLADGDEVLVGLLATRTGNRDTVAIVTRLA